MAFISHEQTEKAKQMDALTYLLNYEPYELVKLSANNYCTRTHDSLKLSNGKWYWWSRGIGGRSAVDYLMAVKDMSFHEAVQTVCDCAEIPYRLTTPKATAPPVKRLFLPKNNDNNDRAISYLIKRGISKSIINYCIEKGLIYESDSHCVIFLGLDEHGKKKYAGVRSIGDKRYVGDAYGSDKRYSFRLVKSDNETVHFFEGAVDLLSYATLLEMQGKDFREYNLVNLAGIYNSKQFDKTVKIPLTIDHYLTQNPQTKRVFLHLDNDLAGQKATKFISRLLSDKYEVINKSPPYGKDVNEYLCKQLGLPIKNKSERNDAR